MKHVVWSEPAILDLDGVHDYISRDSEAYADAVVLEIIDRVEYLAQYPESGRMVPEVGAVEVREIISGSYRVIHQVKDGQIQILSVLHAVRHFPEQ